MSEYKDYSFADDSQAHTSAYLVEPILGLLDKKNVILDVGCGNGWLVNILLEKGYNAYGIDASETGIAVAKQKHPDRFYVQDVTTSELPSELQNIPFKTIVSTEVVEHLYSPRSYVAFCKTVLLKNGGGDFILSTPYHGYLKNLVLSLTGNMDKHFTVLWDGGHIKFWSRNTLTQLLAEAGFEIMKFVGCGRIPYLWKSFILVGRIKR